MWQSFHYENVLGTSLELRVFAASARDGRIAEERAALVGGKRIEPLLFDVSPRHPFVFAFVIIAMLTVAIVASFVPARRAASVDPNVALRSE